MMYVVKERRNEAPPRYDGISIAESLSLISERTKGLLWTESRCSCTDAQNACLRIIVELLMEESQNSEHQGLSPPLLTTSCNPEQPPPKILEAKPPDRAPSRATIV